MPKKIIFLIFSYGILFFSSLFASNVLEVPFLEIPDLSLPELIENKTFKVGAEGFVWKRRLEFKGVSLEDQHHIMYSHVHEFKKRLNALDNDEIIDMTKEIVLADPTLREIFLGLSYKILSSYVTDSIDENYFLIPEVRNIILNSINELKNRNLCMGSFSVFHDGQSVKSSKALEISGKPTIFFSGFSNPLIRILEKNELFKSWSYVIFKQNGNDFNISLFLEDGEVQKLNLFHNVQGCFLQEPQDDLSDKILKFPTGSKEKGNYTHSEQALRLFLLEHPECIPSPISESDTIVLNIYTDRDPCVNCAKALSLETRMFNVNPGTGDINNAYCFVQKRNYRDFLIESPVLDPYQQEAIFPLLTDFYIFVSSSMTESTRGLMGRFLGSIEKPIDPNIKLFFRYNGPFFSHEFIAHQPSSIF